MQRPLARINRYWLQIAQKSEFLCRFHALFLTQAFSLEARAVVAGQVSHLANRQNQEQTNYFLRRGVHRLEKGLIMPNRREIFGLDYIEDLVETYSLAFKAELDTGEMDWAHQVLTEYFNVVGHHQIIARARTVFETLPSRNPATDEPLTPYYQDRTVQASVTREAMYTLAQRRRSVRFFKQDRVPRQLLDSALEIATLSPTACNRQPIEFKVYDAPEKASEIAKFAGGTAGFVEGIPCTVVVVGRLRAYPYSRDRHVIYVDGGLASMSFMFALETLGLASCPINWPDVRERELALAKVLDLKSDERVVMLIAIGFPSDNAMVAASKKQSLSIFRSYDETYPAADRENLVK